MSAASIKRTALSLIWTGEVPDCLAPPFGPLVDPTAYRTAYADQLFAGDQVGPPWELGRSGKWNRFWAAYLVKRKSARNLTRDTAWDFLVPLAWKHGFTYTGPAGVEVDLEAWLYPHACVVVGSVRVEGDWTVETLPDALVAVREATTYGSTTAAGSTANRSLDGLAEDLVTAAAAKISPSNSNDNLILRGPMTVTAAVGGEGDADALDVGQEPVARCLAGLASLSPPGAADPKRFFDPNSDSKARARIYWTKTGHVIWRPDEIVKPSASEPVLCLHRNHTHALAHAQALSVVVDWAAEKVAAKVNIPTAVHSLLARAVYRLDRLATGNTKETYRSGIVAKRLESMPDKIKAVRNGTGLGWAL